MTGPGAPTASGARDRSARRLAWLALVAMLPLLPTLRAAYMYDDTTIIRYNVSLRGWGALLHVWREPYWPTTALDELGLYRPVHVALLATVWNVAHGAAIAFHLYALLLAAAVALGVWAMLRRGVDAWAALLAAGWFAAHPLHVEAIASVANTSELLAVLFTTALVALLARRDDERRLAGTSWSVALLAGLAAAGALLAKESGLLAAPLALVTVWGWRRASDAGPTWRGLLYSRRRAIVAAGIAVAGALVLRRHVLGATVTRIAIAIEGLDVDGPHRVLAMLSLWPHVARTLLWPGTLAPYYGPSIIPVHVVLAAAAGVLVALALVLAACRLALRGDRRPLVAIAWIGLTYLPASNLLVAAGPITSDRTLFGATAGAAFALAWAVDRAGPRWRRAATVVMLLAILNGAVRTARYAWTWSSHRALWTHLIAAQPREYLGYKLLGMDARARHEYGRAIPLLARANAMAPADWQVRLELGKALFADSRFAESAVAFRGFLADPNAPHEPPFVAMYLDAVGRAHGAGEVIEAARPLLHPPTEPTAALYVGLAYERLGDRARADSTYRAALATAPGDGALRQRLDALGMTARSAHPAAR